MVFPDLFAPDGKKKKKLPEEFDLGSAPGKIEPFSDFANIAASPKAAELRLQQDQNQYADYVADQKLQSIQMSKIPEPEVELARWDDPDNPYGIPQQRDWAERTEEPVIQERPTESERLQRRANIEMGYATRDFDPEGALPWEVADEEELEQHLETAKVLTKPDDIDDSVWESNPQFWVNKEMWSSKQIKENRQDFLQAQMDEWQGVEGDNAFEIAENRRKLNARFQQSGLPQVAPRRFHVAKDVLNLYLSLPTAIVTGQSGEHFKELFAGRITLAQFSDRVTDEVEELPFWASSILGVILDPLTYLAGAGAVMKGARVFAATKAGKEFAKTAVGSAASKIAPVLKANMAAETVKQASPDMVNLTFKMLHRVGFMDQMIQVFPPGGRLTGVSADVAETLAKVHAFPQFTMPVQTKAMRLRDVAGADDPLGFLMKTELPVEEVEIAKAVLGEPTGRILIDLANLTEPMARELLRGVAKLSDEQIGFFQKGLVGKGFSDTQVKDILKDSVLRGVGGGAITAFAHVKNVADLSDHIHRFQAIRPGLTRIQRITRASLDFMGDVTPSEKAKEFLRLMGPDEFGSPARHAMMQEMFPISSVATSVSQKTGAWVDEIFEISNGGAITKRKAAQLGRKSFVGIDETLAGLPPSVQDIAARLPKFYRHLSVPEKQFFEYLRVEMHAVGRMLKAAGIGPDKWGFRPDIIKGRFGAPDGYYIPRGPAGEAAGELDQVGVLQKFLDKSLSPDGIAGKNFKFKPPSSIAGVPPRPAVFDSMAQGIDKGWGYHPLDEVLHRYVEQASRASLEKEIGTYLKTSVDKAGKLIGSTPEQRMVQRAPELVSEFKFLQREMQSLPPLLGRMKNTIIDMTEDMVAGKRSPVHLKRALKEIEDVVVETQDVKATGAIRLYEGKTKDEIAEAIGKVKARLKDIEPKWESLKKKAAQEANMDLFDLNGWTFPETTARAVNRAVKNVKPPEERANLIRAANAILRTLNATLDNSAMFLQGLLGFYESPRAWSKAMKVNIQAFWDSKALGKYIMDFDRLAAARNMPTARQYASNGLRLGGSTGEFTLGGYSGIAGHIGRFAGIKQANRAFGYFGDTLRLGLAEAEYERLLVSGVNLKGAAATGQLKKINETINNSTGWSSSQILNVFDMVNFAPRYLLSRFQTYVKALTGLHPHATIERRYARRAVLKLVAYGTAITELANWSQGNETDRRPFIKVLDPGRFDKLANIGLPMDSDLRFIAEGKAHHGEKVETLMLDLEGPKAQDLTPEQREYLEDWTIWDTNPNFMKIRYAGRDWSVFGPWMAIPQILMGIAQGDTEAVGRRVVNAPVAKISWDLVRGKDFDGIPTRNNLANFGRYIGSAVTPFSSQEFDELRWTPREGEEDFNLLKQLGHNAILTFGEMGGVSSRRLSLEDLRMEYADKENEEAAKLGKEPPYPHADKGILSKGERTYIDSVQPEIIERQADYETEIDLEKGGDYAQDRYPIVRSEQEEILKEKIDKGLIQKDLKEAVQEYLKRVFTAHQDLYGEDLLLHWKKQKRVPDTLKDMYAQQYWAVELKEDEWGDLDYEARDEERKEVLQRAREHGIRDAEQYITGTGDTDYLSDNFTHKETQELVRQYRSDMESLRDYWGLTKKYMIKLGVWEIHHWLWKSNKVSSEQRVFYMKGDFMGTEGHTYKTVLKLLNDERNGIKAAWRRANPEEDKAFVFWGFGTMTMAQKDAMRGW